MKWIIIACMLLIGCESNYNEKHYYEMYSMQRKQTQNYILSAISVLGTDSCDYYLDQAKKSGHIEDSLFNLYLGNTPISNKERHLGLILKAMRDSPSTLTP